MRQIDIFLKRTVNLRRHVTLLAAVPEGFGRSQYGCGKLPQSLDFGCPAVDRVQAADRLNPAPAAVAEGERHPVAADKPAALVYQGEACRSHIERSMDRLDELFKLLPERLVFFQLPQSAIL
jgi:hypothetical protein